MSTRTKKFIYGFLPAFAISVTYLVIVVVLAPEWKDAETTFRSNVVLSFFCPVIVPIIAGVLVSSIEPAEFLRTRAQKVVASALGIFVLVCGVLMISSSSDEAIQDRAVEPIEWKTPLRKAFFDLDSQLRRAQEAGEDLCTLDGKPISDAMECYRAKVRELNNNQPVMLSKNMDLASWWQRLVSFQANVLAAFILVTLLMYHLIGKQNRKVQEALIVALALFSLWIPLRIYADWYISFRSIRALSDNTIPIVLGLVILIALLVTFVRTFGGPLPKIFGIVGAAVSAAAAVIGGMNTALFALVARWLSHASLIQLVVGEVALLLLLFALLGPPVLAEPEDQRPADDA